MKTEKNKLINSVDNDNSPVADSVKRKPGRPKKPDPVQAKTGTAGTLARRKTTAKTPAKTRAKTTDDNLPVQPKKRGRPKGTKNKSIRKDHDINAMVNPGDNTRILNYSLCLSRLPKIDINNLQAVQNRIDEFFTISAQHDMKPAVASLALSFGIDRMTLFNWLNGKCVVNKRKECIDSIKAAYQVINSQYEIYMNNGKINPVAGIFLMKNNMGYKDTTDYIITANTDNQSTVEDISNRAGLLD